MNNTAQPRFATGNAEADIARRYAILLNEFKTSETTLMLELETIRHSSADVYSKFILESINEADYICATKSYIRGYRELECEMRYLRCDEFACLIRVCNAYA